MALAISRFTQGDKNAVGDVKDSILTEAQFVAENGPGWVLADGRSIVGSLLHQKYGFTTATDIRGQFRRAKNNGRSDGNQDPGGERAIGNLQGQATARNGLTASSSDSGHVHQEIANAGNGVAGAYYMIAATTWNAPSLPNPVGVNSNTATGYSSITTTIGAGDAETRPKNVAVNVFIKIN